MLTELVLLTLLAFLASTAGTLTGFGTSTIMVPVLLFFFPLPVTLLFVGIIHWFGDIWKMVIFRSGIRWRIVLLFGASGLVASYLGARLTIALPEAVLSRLLAAFLLAYVGWLMLKPRWQLPQRDAWAVAGGALSGFLTGIVGVGGAVRGAFLSAYNLPKDAYLFTIGIIAFVVDSIRLAVYWQQDTTIPEALWLPLLTAIPVSLLGAYLAQRLLARIPQQQFRTVVAIGLGLVAVALLI